MIKVQTINLGPSLVREINKWLRSPADRDSSIATINFDSSFVPDILKRECKKSVFVRETLIAYLHLLKLKFPESHIISCSRSEFVRVAILLRKLGLLPEIEVEPEPERLTSIEIFMKENGYHFKKGPLGNGYHPEMDYTQKEALRI